MARSLPDRTAHIPVLIARTRHPRLRSSLWRVLEGELPAEAAHGEGIPLGVVEEAVDAIPRLREWGALLAECRPHLDGSADRGLGGL